MVYMEQWTNRAENPVVVTNPAELEGMVLSVTSRFAGPDRDFSGGEAGVFTLSVSLGRERASVSFCQDVGLGQLEATSKNKRRRLQEELDELKEGYRLQCVESGSAEIDLNEILRRLDWGGSGRPSQ